MFGQSQVNFFSHANLAVGLEPWKTAAAQFFAHPITVKELQGFLRMVYNFNQSYLPGMAPSLVPLTNALCSGGKENAAIS
jgi:hypothetical protein